MITQLTLHNWKSIEKTTLQIDQITFLIGVNASGKSNIVDALKFISILPNCSSLSDACSQIRGGMDWIVMSDKRQSTLEVTVKLDKKTFVYGITFSTDGKEAVVEGECLRCILENGDVRYLFCSEDSSTHDSQSSLSVSFQKSKSTERRLMEVRNDIPVLAQINGLNVIRDVKDAASAISSQLSDIFVFLPNPDSMRGFCSVSEKMEPDGSNIAGVIESLPPDRKKRFLDDIYRYVKSLPERDLRKVWTEPVGRFGDAAMLYCEEEWKDNIKPLEIDARSMSYGTLRFIAIISALLYAKPDSLIVIEEIDNGLHPSRSGELVHAMTDIASFGEIDILCTTHNPVLIDSLSGELLLSVNCLSRDSSSGGTVISKLDDMPSFLHDLANFTPGQMMVKQILS